MCVHVPNKEEIIILNGGNYILNKISFYYIIQINKVSAYPTKLLEISRNGFAASRPYQFIHISRVSLSFEHIFPFCNQINRKDILTTLLYL